MSSARGKYVFTEYSYEVSALSVRPAYLTSTVYRQVTLLLPIIPICPSLRPASGYLVITKYNHGDMHRMERSILPVLGLKIPQIIYLYFFYFTLPLLALCYGYCLYLPDLQPMLFLHTLGRHYV